MSGIERNVIIKGLIKSHFLPIVVRINTISIISIVVPNFRNCFVSDEKRVLNVFIF